MNKPIIEVNGIYKKYRLLARQPYYALRDEITSLLRDPFSRLKGDLSKHGRLAKDEFWALRDIHIKVSEGEVIGIIGRNGAGKTTLLKVLSRITPPTKGEIILRGRVASLLEVGTGFHPELTGRENIFLNGALLGMKQNEIREKFDEIVDFAEIEKFLDMTVKRYSSGMYMRLAFAVAAHLEPEILIVDEVLAVGDAAFQEKCLGKMQNISRKGKTILFVSHNMSAIRSLCSKGILLTDGKASSMLPIDDLIKRYETWKTKVGRATVVNIPSRPVSFTDFRINDTPISKKPEIFPDTPLTVTFSYQSAKVYDLCISLALRRTSDFTLMTYTHNHLENVHHMTGKQGRVNVTVPLPHLAPGDYVVEIQVWLDTELVLNEYEVGEITIVPIPAFASNQTFQTFPAGLLLRSDWEFQKT